MAPVVIEGKATISYNNITKILKLEFAKGSDIDLFSAKQISTAISKLTNDELHVNLVDISKMTFMNNDARKHFGGQNKETVAAVGIVLNSKFQSALTNLYKKINRPLLPTKFFDSVQGAEAWLKQMLEEHKRKNRRAS